MYSVSRPCSEEVITPFFQDGISGALPDWATQNWFGVRDVIFEGEV